MMLNQKETEEKLAPQEKKIDAELNGDMKLLEDKCTVTYQVQLLSNKIRTLGKRPCNWQKWGQLSSHLWA